MKSFFKLVKENWIIITILLFALLLRFWKLDSYPALNADEAAIGYNAYSLLETGRDEHGNTWPIHFQSFNDYKPGLYFYMILPFVKVLGLTEWAVRIPGAAIGGLTVLVLYLLVLDLFKNRKLAYISAFFLAISPWHIHFSRGGWEVNVATFFITLGVWFYVKSENIKFRYLVFSVFSFAAALYTYHAARVVIPLLVIWLLAISYKSLLKNVRNLIFLGLISLVLMVPLARDFMSGAGISRATGVSIFADVGSVNRANEQRGEHSNYLSFLPKVLHNKFVNYGLLYVNNWTKHFWGEFLFLSGDVIERNRVPETGLMYIADFVFLVVGFCSLIKKTHPSWKFVLWWLVAAPSAAALTFQSPHALRGHNMVIPLVIVSAYGFLTILEWLENNKYILGKWILIGIVLLQFGRYEHMYWVHMAKEYPASSQYGVKELANYVKDNQDKYDKIVVTDRYDQPYILFLFYLKYSPAKFQKDHTLTTRDNFGFSTVRNFDKYVFTSITGWDSLRQQYPHALIAGTDEEIYPGTNVVKEIYGSNGHLYFQLIAN